MAGDVGSLSIKLIANAVEYVEGLSRAQYATEKSAREMQRSLEAIEKNANQLVTAIKGVAVAALAGFSLSAMESEFRKTVAMAANMRDLALSVGGTVERMSALVGVAQLSNTASETLAGGLQRLSKGMSGVDDEGTNTARALKAMGIDIHTTTGELKTSDEMFVEISRTMATYKDGTEKTALAIALFGRGGAQLLPVMKDLAEAGDLNARLTTKQAEEADRFEKSLRELERTKKDITKTIVFEALPAAQSFVGALIDLGKEAGGARDKINDLKKEGQLAEWANTIAINGAQIVDAFRMVGAAALALGGSFKSVGADIYFAYKAMQLMTTPDIPGLVAAYQARQDAATAGNKAWADLLNMDLNKTENYVRQRQAFQRTMAGITWDTTLGEPGVAPLVPDKPGKDKQPHEIRGLADAMKYLGEIEAQNVGIDKAFYEGMEKLQIVLDNHPELIDRVVDAYMSLYDAHMKVVNDPLLKSQAAYDTAMQKQREILAGVTRDLAGYVKVQGDGIKAMDDSAHAQNEARFLLEQNNIIAQAWAAIYEAMGGDVLPAVTLAFINMGQAAKGTAKVLADDTGLKNAQMLVKAITDETAVMALDDEQRAKSIALKQLDATGINKLGNEYDVLRERIIASLDARKYDAELKGLANSLTDVVLDAFQGGKGAIAKIIQILKDEFAKLVLRPIIAPIMTAAANWFLGLLGLAGSGSAAAAGGGGTPLLSLASMGKGLFDTGTSAWNWLSGAGQYGMADRSLGTTNFWSAGSFGDMSTAGGIFGTAALGAMGGSLISGWISKDEDASRNGALYGAAGSVIGSYALAGSVGGPWGAVIGAVIGGLVAAFSDMDGPAMRTARIVAGQTMDKYTYGMESRIGTLGIERGSDKWFSDSEMGQTLTEWFKALTDIDNSIADRLSPGQLTAAQAAVGGGGRGYLFGMEHTDLDPALFGQMAQARYGAIFGAIDAEMGRLITSFEGTTGDLLKLVDDLANVTWSLTANGDKWQKLIGEGFGITEIEKFHKEGETYSATLERIGDVFLATNAIAEMVGKTQVDVWGAVGLASEAAREALIEAAGGLDALTGSLNSYYNHYFSAEEKRTRQGQALQTFFEGIGQTMPTTLRGFRDLVDGIINGVNPALSLQTEAGRQLLASLLGVEGTFYDFITATDDAGAALEDWNKRLRDAASTLYDSLTRDIRQMTIGGLSGEPLTAFYRDEYNTNKSMIGQATTPEDVMKWTGLARDTLMDWWQSLAKEDQDRLRGWFLDQLRGLGGTSLNRLGELSAQGPAGMTPEARAALDSDSAKTQKGAAEIQRDAANTQAAAAQTMLDASYVPRRVIIDLPALGARAEVGV